MKRKDVARAAEELGYYMFRKAKHSDLYRHKETGKIVGVAHTPSDHRALQNTMADLRRGAKGDGGPSLRQQVADRLAELTSDARPWRRAELIEELDVEASTFTVDKAIAGLAEEGRLVAIYKGWYVRDDELAGLPERARRDACAEIRRIGPVKAYARRELRDAAVAEALSNERIRERLMRKQADEAAEEAAGIAKDRRPPTRGAPAPVTSAPARLFELLGESEVGGTAVAVLRDEDGGLWIARPVR